MQEYRPNLKTNGKRAANKVVSIHCKFSRCHLFQCRIQLYQFHGMDIIKQRQVLHKKCFCFHIMVYLFTTPCSLVNGYHLQSSMLPPPSGSPAGHMEQHRRRSVHEIPSPCTPQIFTFMRPCIIIASFK